MCDDASQLSEFARTGSEPAFRQLVARHFDLVHATALRRVNGDRSLAQELAQTVFTDLARQARTLPTDTILAGWLYRHTCFQAAEAIRANRRRIAREQAAALMHSIERSGHDADWEEIGPLLDEAMQELGPADRDALVLRFFEHGDFRTVGAALGVSDDTAQKRVSRALERLRAALARRGITSTATALAGAIGAHAVVPAPLGVAAQVATAALAAGTAASAGGFAALLAHFMGMTKLQTGVICAVLATVPLAVQQRAAGAAQSEARGLAAELARWRTAATSAAATNAALRRQADRYRGSRRQWERERTLAAAVAANRGGIEDAPFYRWNEAEEFARLPKSVLTNVAIRDWDSEATVGSGRGTVAPVAPDGTPSALLMEVLGLDAGQQAAVTDLCQRFFRDYETQARARSQFLTEIPAGVSADLIRPQADLHLRLTAALATEESAALRAEFRAGLEERMGRGPAAAFWEQVADVFGGRCDDFGSFSRLFGVRRNSGAGDRPEDQWFLIRMRHQLGAWRWDGEVPGYRAGRDVFIAELAAGPAVRFETNSVPIQP
jgi:RNA polymerase sigma factor (sigma-70 family)